MPWNWQLPDWPRFAYDAAALEPLERRFLARAGELVGVFRHVGPYERDQLRVELIGDEAVKTSEIEGEVLDRAGVQSSLREQLGLGGGLRRVAAAEHGIAEMMVDLHRTFADALTHEAMSAWYRMLMRGRRLDVLGAYRRHAEPMQVVSGDPHRPRVHLTAPPSARVAVEMRRFVAWFNETAPGGRRPLSALARAGIAHLHFVSVHPFEDGNGRIGRALAEKSLAQNVGQPTLIALSQTIERHRKAYYAALERNSTSTEITDWLTHFAEMVVEAQFATIRRVDFVVAKTKWFDRLRGRLNARQEKAATRMFREGVAGFAGGLSAEKYISITKASRATATRDLQDLVAKGGLTRTGARRHTRYFLKLAE